MTPAKQRKRRVLTLLLLLLLLILLGYRLWPEPPWYDHTQAPYQLHLEPTQYAANFGDTIPAEFGTLTVPENRSSDSSNIIQLAFIRFASLSDQPGPPIFYLSGGPGTPGIPTAKGELFRFFMGLRHFGDVVLIDQRGVGQSKPKLECGITLGLDTDIQDDIPGEITKTLAERFGECADYLRERGVNLSAYNTNENADDIDDIRNALQYDSVVLLGYSYGTELAQVVIRRHEEHVAKAILMGPVAPDQARKLPSEMHAYFTRIDSMLAVDLRNQKVMPNFLKTMREVHGQLKQHPKFVQVPLLDAVDEEEGIGYSIFKAISWFKPNWEMYLGNTHLEIMDANNVTSDFWTRRFPQFYYDLANDDYRTAGNWLRNFRRRDIGTPMRGLMIAATGCSGAREAQAKRESDTTILGDLGISTTRQESVAHAWGNIGLGDDYRQPITSNVPVLIVTGTLDGVTPMNNGIELHERFPHSTLITIQNATHDGLIQTGSIARVRQFLSDSTIAIDPIVEPFYFFPIKADKYSLRDTLNTIIKSQGIDSAVALYHHLYAEYGNSGDYVFEFEEYELNNLGYALLVEGQDEAALAIFGLNIETHPERPNVYDSYAEALAALGRKDEAIEYYQRSIKLNPLNNNAYMKLRELGIEIPY